MMGRALSWEDLRSLFSEYEKSLRPLLELSREKYQIQRDAQLVRSSLTRGMALPVAANSRLSAQTLEQRQEKIAGLRLDGRKVEDLYLDFTLPGHHEWELKVTTQLLPLHDHHLHMFYVSISTLLLYQRAASRWRYRLDHRQRGRVRFADRAGSA